MVEVCSQCHPFYTGKQKILDSGGRVARFEKRYGKRKAGEPRRLPTTSCLDRRPLCRAIAQAGRRFAFAGKSQAEQEGDHDAAARRRSTRCSPSTPTSSVSSPIPNCTPTPADARKVGRRFAAAGADRGDLPQAGDGPRRPGGRPRTRRRRRVLRRRGPRARGHASPNSTPQLTDLLAPRDPHDADDVVLEVKSGEGGEESALFAADLARMYIRYAERHGWNGHGARRDRPPISAATRTRRCRSPARATPPTACGRG